MWMSSTALDYVGSSLAMQTKSLDAVLRALVASFSSYAKADSQGRKNRLSDANMS